MSKLEEIDSYSDRVFHSFILAHTPDGFLWLKPDDVTSRKDTPELHSGENLHKIKQEKYRISFN